MREWHGLSSRFSFVAALAIVAVPMLLPLVSASGKNDMTTTTRPAEQLVEEGLVIKLTQQGLDYLAALLESGLESQNLKRDIVEALENQQFNILIPQLGGYADITVDYGVGRPKSYLDGFRYDNVRIELTSIPLAPRIVPESGVIYPALHLAHYQGDQLPQLHVFIVYPPFIPAATPVSAIAEAILVTSGILRPSFDDGEFKVLAEDFETSVTEMDIVAWQNFPEALSSQEVALKEALGQAVLDGMNKEVNDALSDVFMSGLNDILFDRDKDGKEDLLVNVSDMFKDLNNQFGTTFSYSFHSRFQSNPVTPAEAILHIDTSIFSEAGAHCMGVDGFGEPRYTLLERDGNFGHDPPNIPLALPSGKPYQFGASFSDDLINNILFAIYRSGKLCVTLGADSADLPADLRDLLNTDTFAAIGGQWLADAAPGAPLRFSIHPYRAPYVVIPEGDTTLDLHLPGFYLDVYVELGGSWYRAVGYDASMQAKLEFNGINIGSSPVLDLSLEVLSQTEPIFGEMIPDADPKSVAKLFPTLFAVAGGQIEELAGSLQFALLDCIDGIKVQDFYLRKDGIADGQANYLQLFINLAGMTDLGELLGSCLLGEPLIPAATTTLSRYAAAGGQPAMGSIADSLAISSLSQRILPPTSATVSSYQLNGGGRSPASADGIKASHLRPGLNHILWYQGTEKIGEQRVLLDLTPPSVHFETSGNRRQIKLGETINPNAGWWVQYDRNGAVIDQGRGLTSLVPLQPRAARILARNAVGLETVVPVPAEVHSSVGCSTAGTNDILPIMLLLLAFYRLMRKRHTTATT